MFENEGTLLDKMAEGARVDRQILPPSPGCGLHADILLAGRGPALALIHISNLSAIRQSREPLTVTAVRRTMTSDCTLPWVCTSSMSLVDEGFMQELAFVSRSYAREITGRVF